MKQARRQESGFALLFVFAMAAAVAIMLYMELPRVMFEAQREREILLIERGEQYQRAITLFVRKNRRFPTSIEELEETNNVRFLRKRFKDPMTGKDEWRLIHSDGVRLTDSLVQKPDDPANAGKDGKSSGTGDAAASGAASASGMMAWNQVGAPPAPGAPGSEQPLELWQQRRPSDRPAAGVPPAGMPVDPNNPNQDPNLDPNQNPNAQNSPGQPVGPGYPAPNQNLPPGAAYDPNSQPNPAAPGVPGQPQPGVPGQPPPGVPGQPPPGMPPGLWQRIQQGANPGAPGVPYPVAGQPAPNPPAGVPAGAAPAPVGAGGAPASSKPTDVASLMRSILFTPRQGPAVPAQSSGAAAPGPQRLGAGIAGVASTLEANSIRVYKERTKYNEWEFVYDAAKDLQKAMGAQQTPGLNPSQNPFRNTPNMPQRR